MKIYIFAALAPFMGFIGALAAFIGALAAFIGALAPFMGAAPACEAAWALKAKARRVRALRNLVMVFLSIWEEEFFGKASSQIERNTMTKFLSALTLLAFAFSAQAASHAGAADRKSVV